MVTLISSFFFFFQAEDGIRDVAVTGVQTCALPISHDREDERLRLHGLRESLNGKQDYHDGRPLRNEESHLEPVVFLTALLILVGIPAVTVLKLARLRAARPQSASADVIARLEEIERGVQDLRHELAETQERLDFTQRVLSKAREERR